jgi:hypothetical protein
MTVFQTPLETIGANGDTGNSQTETSGFVHSSKVLSLGSSNSRQIVSLPPFSTLTGLRAIPTSAFAADVSAVNVSWGNSAQATRYGVIAVSALGAMRSASVSAGTDFDAGGTVVVTVSAVSTTTFTAGGVRAFIEYITVA